MTGANAKDWGYDRGATLKGEAWTPEQRGRGLRGGHTFVETLIRGGPFLREAKTRPRRFIRKKRHVNQAAKVRRTEGGAIYCRKNEIVGTKAGNQRN